MMKKLLLIAVLMVSTVIFNSGCEKEKVAKSIVEQTESETVSKSIPFPEHIEQVLSDKIHVNAKIEIPEVCKSGKGTKIKLSQNSFWDNSDQIKEILLNGQKMKEEYVNEYDNWKEKVYITNNDTSLFITLDNYITFMTPQAIFINNVLFSDKRFDDYNGDHDQTKINLPFMTQEDAWTKVQSILQKIGVNEIRMENCYVMDHAVMQDEENVLLAKAQENGDKISQIKNQWTEMDDSYYFEISYSWCGYKIVAPFSGEGTDEYSIKAIYNSQGLSLLGINGYYPLEPDKEFELSLPSDVLMKVKQYIENIISEDSYEIQKMTLCQKVKYVDVEKNKGEIIPAWECQVLVIPEEMPENQYLRKIYFNAETLEAIA